MRDARAVMHVGIANPRWRGKRSWHSRRMRNPQFYVSAKRPMSILELIITQSPDTDVGLQGPLLPTWTNSSSPEQNGRHFADDMFKRIFLNENVRIAIKISLTIVPRGPIENKSALVQVMAWC